MEKEILKSLIHQHRNRFKIEEYESNFSYQKVLEYSYIELLHNLE